MVCSVVRTPAMTGASPDGDRATAVEPLRVSPLRDGIPSAWLPFDSAPRAVPFLALNHDGEVWLAKFEEVHGRLCFRTNSLREGRRFEVRKIDGEEWLKEDHAFAEKNTAWASNWTLWTKGYEFKPTHWFPLPSAQGMSPGTAETRNEAQGEAGQPGPQRGCAQTLPEESTP